ncbi:MAG: tetratricopeptide repeat protein [Bacteroidales bacterium]|nr:tetratricopeptide repeat protein [Bacteroidales bacterium]
MSRSYHNITTRYNILFNAKELYQKGLQRAEESKKEDYTQILPLFLYDDKAAVQAVAGDMGAAAQKATKAVNLHSITAKPKVKKGGMTPEQKKFYDKREFNKYIDDCYLLIGKTYVYSGEYFLAVRSFNFIEAEFPGEPVLYESRIWKAKALIAGKNYREAGILLDELHEDEKFPDNKALRSELEATTADWHIKQKDYAVAIRYLTDALTQTKSLKTQMRYRYILAQLFLEQKDFDNASNSFREVIRMNPPYEMTFNATISMATASKGNGAGTEEVKQQLEKMLRDSKNNEYHDQIYYALAEIEMGENNIRKAIEYYRKSAASSTANIPQKIKSYLTLADLFYEQRQYVPAQAYYDSVMMNAQPDYPNYIRIAAKTKNLNILVENLNTVRFQDSVQRIAQLPETERDKLIDRIISDKQQSERARQESPNQQYAANTQRSNMLPDSKNKAQWYFYNPANVSQGISEFQIKWGKRTLEDNWRRKNKGIATDFNIEESAETEELKVSDTNSRNYYLQFIPLGDSAMDASHRKIQEALYNLGYIYTNDFKELALAAEKYEDLARRYPESPYADAAHYYLYQLYTAMNNPAEADKNKKLLLQHAPESAFAKIVLDPDYLNKLMQEQGEAAGLYEQLYLSYQDEQYAQVIAVAKSALDRYPNDILRAKFAYLKALSTGKLGTQAVMRAELQKITEEYPDNEVAQAAQDIIDYIDGKDPSMKKTAQAQRAQSLYSLNSAETHYFAWILSVKEDFNQLSFDLLNFNLDHYLNTKLEVSRAAFDENHILLIVKSFPDAAQAETYYQTFVKTPNATKNVKNEHTSIIISESNFSILEKDRKIDDYVEFFKKEYLTK